MAKTQSNSMAADTPQTCGAASARTRKPDRAAAGFFCYIGPSIGGLIRHGAIYRGTRRAALTAAAAAIEQYPLVKTLIVSGDKLPAARLKAKRPGSALYQNYQRLAGKA